MDIEGPPPPRPYQVGDRVATRGTRFFNPGRRIVGTVVALTDQRIRIRPDNSVVTILGSPTTVELIIAYNGGSSPTSEPDPE